MSAPSRLARRLGTVDAVVIGLGSLQAVAPVVQVAAAVASLGVLLSRLAGVSRTVFAMAVNHHLPHALARVHERRRVPHRATRLR